MIKEIECKDISACAEVIRESFKTVADELGFTPENAPRFTAFAITKERLDGHYNNEHRSMYAYYDDGVIVGYYSLLLQNNNECELNNLCVIPTYRHRGIGEELLLNAFKVAKEMGCIKVNIGIVEENQVLRKWYESFGFVHIGTKKFEFFPFTCGYMEKHLLGDVMDSQTYVIWLEFDDEFSEFLNEKCNELNEKNIIPGIRPPHLTLTFVRTNDRERLIGVCREYLQKNMVDIEINAIEQFSSGVIYYAPKVTSELLKLHNDLCQRLCEFGELTWDLYHPGNWTPHIALTGESNEQDVQTAVSIMRKSFSKRMVSIKKILVWAYEGDGEKIYIPI